MGANRRGCRTCCQTELAEVETKLACQPAGLPDVLPDQNKKLHGGSMCQPAGLPDVLPDLKKK